MTEPAGFALGAAGFGGGSLDRGVFADSTGLGGLAAVPAVDVGAGFKGLGGGGEIAGLAVAVVAFEGTGTTGAVRDGVVSVRLGAPAPGAARIVVPAGAATFGVAAARAIAAAGDSRSCAGGGLSGSLGGELAGDAGVGRSGKAVVVAGNADDPEAAGAAGAAGPGRVSLTLARAGAAWVAWVACVAGGACCAPLGPAASHSPPTTLAAAMARIHALDFMLPPTLRPEPTAGASMTRPRAMPTERRRAECKRENRRIRALTRVSCEGDGDAVAKPVDGDHNEVQ